MDLGLSGKVAIVTGGGSNIGRAISIALAKEGAQVVIAEIDVNQGGKVVDQIKALGGQAVIIGTDVTDYGQVQEMVTKVLNDFGHIDILVNNVGWTYDRLFIEKPREEWEKEVALNFWGVINCDRAVIEHMIERKYGKIVTISSDAGRMGEYREAVYAGCKGGAIAMSKSIAREVGRYGINVNVICPGATVPDSSEDYGEGSMWAPGGGLRDLGALDPEVQEKMKRAYPLRKLTKPEDIANAVLFFASDVANDITGQILSVSGGYTMM